MSRPALLLVLAGLALVSALAWYALRSGPPDATPSEPARAPAVGGSAPAARAPAAGFVGEALCALCHPEEHALWEGSDHDLAMQEVGPATVLGDFEDARFEKERTPDGVTRFLRREQRFLVETAGPDGLPAEFEVAGVFGVDPLQQYLLPLPGGRLQALSVAWDVGGRRWFSLYPDERIDHQDVLHWTARAMNWNSQCAECHATGLLRNYSLAEDAYGTTWERLDVGCQACHGPAGKHVRWAQEDPGDAAAPAGYGFDAPLPATDSRVEIEACARCHARRANLSDGFDHRNRLMDDYLPALLDEGLYHADGQILDEVYEWGSFLQSPMHAKGVRCSDCHEPHSLRLRAQENALCATCHSPTPRARAHVDTSGLQRKPYDSRAHHFHEPGTPGSRCIDCHMGARTYMGVDPRRDHSFRVPRPELSAAIGAPDACTGCHGERDAAWAAETIAGWYGRRAERAAHFGWALQAGRTGASGAAEALVELAGDERAPAIARATALALLPRYPGQPALAALAAGLADPEPLVRRASASGLELLPPVERVPLSAPLLADPVRAVRIEAARLLAPLPPAALGPLRGQLGAALAEYEAVQRSLSEHPEAHLNLANLLLDLGRASEAEAELRTALRLDPRFAPAYVNLAEHLHRAGREPEAEELLRSGLGHLPEEAALHHALGLSLVRLGRHAEALSALALAARLAPREARLGYVHAVALHDSGRIDESRAELERVLALAPWDRDARLTLAGFLEEADDRAGAERCRRALQAINPDDPALAGAFSPESGGR